MIVRRTIHAAFARPGIEAPFRVRVDHAVFLVRQRAQLLPESRFTCGAAFLLFRLALGACALGRSGDLALCDADALFESFRIELGKPLPTVRLDIRNADIGEFQTFTVKV